MSKVLRIGRHIPSALQGSFSFPVRAISLTIEHPLERVAFRTALMLLAILLCGYLYFVSASILNVMARKEAAVAAASVQNAIATFEQQYFVLSDKVTQERGIAMGLHPVNEVSYVYRPGNTAAGTMERNEI